MSLVLLARYWREGVIGLLMVCLVALMAVDGAALRRCKRHGVEVEHTLEQTKSDYAVAQAVAASNNVVEVRKIEQANAAKTSEITNDLEHQLADARTRGDAYVQRMRDQAAAAVRAARAAGTSSQANTAVPVDKAGGTALLADDVRVCTDNTVKLESWQKWYGSLMW